MSKDIQEKIVDMKRVLRMVEDELVRGWTKHPTPFHNAHEGHSVIREELDELWDEVKADTAYTHAGMKEAIQVAAMGVRFVVELHDHPNANPASALFLASSEAG
jgi:hypothetical protein